MAISTVSVGQKIKATLINSIINLVNKMLPVQIGTFGFTIPSGSNTAQSQVVTFGTAFTSTPTVFVIQTSTDLGISYAVTATSTTQATIQGSSIASLAISHPVTGKYIAFGPY